MMHFSVMDLNVFNEDIESIRCGFIEAEFNLFLCIHHFLWFNNSYLKTLFSCKGRLAVRTGKWFRSNVNQHVLLQI